MISVLVERSRQCLASSFQRLPARRGPAAACFFGSAALAASWVASGFAASLAMGLSWAPTAAAKDAISEKTMCFMALPCFHETMFEEYRVFGTPAQPSTAGGEMSQLRAEKPQRVLPQFLGPGAVLPRFERNALRALEVVFEDARLRERELTV